MPTEVISCGPPTTIAQTTAYALPAPAVWIVSNAALEFSLQSTTGFVAAAASTTGMQSSYPFCRCAGSTAIVSVRKIG